jgi:hypothetical protein
LRLRLAGGPELDSGSHPSLLTRWVNWSGARGCVVMLTKSSRDRPSACHVAAVGHRVPAEPAPRPVSLRHLVRRLRWPRSVGCLSLGGLSRLSTVCQARDPNSSSWLGLTSESPGVLGGAGAVMRPCLGGAAAPRLLAGHELFYQREFHRGG